MQTLRPSATPVQLRKPCYGRVGGHPRSCRRLVVLAALPPEAGGETLRPKPCGVFSRLADVLPVRRRKCGQSDVKDALPGGGPPRLPPPRSGGGGGGGGGDDDAGQDGKKKGFGWKGWDDRVAADPQFVYKVLVEQIIGVGASVIGDMSTRPNWGLNELDFVFSTLVVGSIMNFTLMYLLAPTTAAAAGAASKNIFMRLFDERTLTAMGAPGGHIFQPGFSFKGRMINLFFKSFTFGLIGFAAGVFGTTMSNTLIKVRVMTDPKFKLQNETPDVFLNALAWTAHMGLSSNIRYQTLNGMEMGLVRLLPPPLFKVFVVLLRTANNLLGGMSFVTCARIIGSQKENKVVEPPAPEPKKGKKKN